MKVPFRFEFDDDGTFHLRGTDGFREAVCPTCGEPIKWALDMFSFATGDDHVLQHARCTWIPEAFDRERLLSTPPNQEDEG